MNGSQGKRVIHWSYLKGALAMAVASLLLAGGALVAIHLERDRLDQRVVETHRALEAARTAYQRQVESMRLYEQHHQAWERLQTQRLFQGPDRLALVELFNGLRRELQLPYLGFRFEPRAPLENYHGLAAPGYRLEGSLQKIEFSLHHEGELDLLLERLRAARQGYFVVESCRMTRPDRQLYLVEKGNVQGRCLLRWLVLVPREAKDAAG